MTVQYMSEYTIEGLDTDLKPVWKTESTANGYLPAGAKFYEINTKRTYTFDGAGTWYLGPGVNYYGDTRVTIPINTTTTEKFWGTTSFPKSGEKLIQWVVTAGNVTGAPTRTFYIFTGTTATVLYTSTAITNNSVAVRTLLTTEGVILDGIYGVNWVMSAVGESCSTDYYTLYWGR